MNRSRTVFLVVPGIFFLMSALHMVRFYTQRGDIWWTPMALALPLVDVSDRVEVYVRDVPLQEHVKARRIQLLSDAGANSVTERDIRMRVNNWDRVRVQMMPTLVPAAACLGASGVLILFGVLGWGPRERWRHTE